MNKETGHGTITTAEWPRDKAVIHPTPMRPFQIKYIYLYLCLMGLK